MNSVSGTGIPQVYHHRFSPFLEDGDRAWVFGVVTAVRESKNSVFMDLLHALGSIQIVGLRESLGDSWNQVRTIKTRARIKAIGRIGRTQKGHRSLFLESVPIAAGAFLDGSLSSVDPDYRQVGAGLLIAQARSAAEAYLASEKFLPIDPRYVSASWPTDRGMIPLHVSYPGFGHPVYLAPSPAQQLALAIAATGDDRVFCSATSFTTSYRQPSDGVETAIVMAMTLGLDIREMISHSIHLLDAVCASMPGTNRRFDAQNIEQKHCPISDLVVPDSASDCEDCIVWVHPRDSNGVQPFRLVLEKGISPIEGCVEFQEGGIAVGTLVFHVDRMLPLAEHVQFRRLRHLAREFGEESQPSA